MPLPAEESNRAGDMAVCLSVEGIDYEAWVGLYAYYDERTEALKVTADCLVGELKGCLMPGTSITVERYPYAGTEILDRYGLR